MCPTGLVCLYQCINQHVYTSAIKSKTKGQGALLPHLSPSQVPQLRDTTQKHTTSFQTPEVESEFQESTSCSCLTNSCSAFHLTAIWKALWAPDCFLLETVYQTGWAEPFPFQTVLSAYKLQLPQTAIIVWQRLSPHGGQRRLKGHNRNDRNTNVSQVPITSQKLSK